MGFLSSSEKKEQIVALFDIGSESVGGALVHIPFDREETPTILKSVRTSIRVRSDLDFDTLLIDMTKALGVASHELYQKKLGRVDKIMCVLASPWYISETREIKMSRKSSFTLTNHVANELLQKEVALLKDTYEKKYGKDTDAEILEHHIVGVALNGYPTIDPIGKRSRSIEMDMVVSLSPKTCLDKIKETVAQTFHDTPVRFASFATTSYFVIRDKYPHLDSYMMLDVGGEVSDISIISKGVLKSSVSFPFGYSTVFKELAKKLSIELRDAQELLLLYTTGMLERKRSDSIKKLLATIGDSWSKALRDSISLLPQVFSLPDTVFLTTDTALQTWIASVLKEEEYVKSLTHSHNLSVVTLDGPEFLRICSVKENSCDPFLMIEAVALSRNFNLHL
jgi:hypothetical protein